MSQADVENDLTTEAQPARGLGGRRVLNIPQGEVAGDEELLSDLSAGRAKAACRRARATTKHKAKSQRKLLTFLAVSAWLTVGVVTGAMALNWPLIGTMAITCGIGGGVFVLGGLGVLVLLRRNRT